MTEVFSLLLPVRFQKLLDMPYDSYGNLLVTRELTTAASQIFSSFESETSLVSTQPSMYLEKRSPLNLWKSL